MQRFEKRKANIILSEVEWEVQKQVHPIPMIVFKNSIAVYLLKNAYLPAYQRPA